MCESRVLPAQQAIARHLSSITGEKRWRAASNLTSLDRLPTDSPRLDALSKVQELLSDNHLFDTQGKLHISPIWLRDACTCPKCVDPSTRQREFSFTDIPLNISAKPTARTTDGGWEVSWENDIPGFERHISTFTPMDMAVLADRKSANELRRTLWDKASFSLRARRCTYEEYMHDEASLTDTLRKLFRDGLVFISEVPCNEQSVSNIAQRIGPIRNTFYGQTWDVKSKPDPVNVAYTSKHLGFHMDLLYMKQPPKLQLLHCLENSCLGGESRFVDTLKALDVLSCTDAEALTILAEMSIIYQYKNKDHSYAQTRPVIEQFPGRRRARTDGAERAKIIDKVAHVWWSPPFVGRMFSRIAWPQELRKMASAARKLADIFEQDDLVHTTRLEAGTCVIFDNTRILHARNAFDLGSGHRWLRGAYVDGDALGSRSRTVGAWLSPPIEKSAKVAAAAS